LVDAIDSTKLNLYPLNLETDDDVQVLCMVAGALEVISDHNDEFETWTKTMAAGMKTKTCPRSRLDSERRPKVITGEVLGPSRPHTQPFFAPNSLVGRAILAPRDYDTDAGNGYHPRLLPQTGLGDTLFPNHVTRQDIKQLLCEVADRTEIFLQSSSYAGFTDLVEPDQRPIWAGNQVLPYMAADHNPGFGC
jgi:hypothetical protein